MVQASVELDEPLPVQLRTLGRDRQVLYAAAARAVATVRLGLPLAMPRATRGWRSTPLPKPAPGSQHDRLARRLVVTLAGYCALIRVGVPEHHARLRCGAEFKLASKLGAELGLTESNALAKARTFVVDRRNWRAIQHVAGSMANHAAQIAELKRWHNREVRIVLTLSDSGAKRPPDWPKREWTEVIIHQELAANEMCGFMMDGSEGSS